MKLYIPMTIMGILNLNPVNRSIDSLYWKSVVWNQNTNKLKKSDPDHVSLTC